MTCFAPSATIWRSSDSAHVSIGNPIERSRRRTAANTRAVSEDLTPRSAMMAKNSRANTPADSSP